MEDVIAGRSNTQTTVFSVQLSAVRPKINIHKKNTDQTDFNSLISKPNDFGYEWLSLYCVENDVLNSQKMTLDEYQRSARISYT